MAFLLSLVDTVCTTADDILSSVPIIGPTLSELVASICNIVASILGGNNV